MKTLSEVKEMPAGRPTLYKDEYNDLVYKFCLLGATDAELARFLGIEESTLNLWKEKHPKFMESIRNGKEVADAEVAQKLYHRAKGYSHPDTQFATFQGQITDQVEYTKHYPPDSVAAMFWLKNRKAEAWKDRRG